MNESDLREMDEQLRTAQIMAGPAEVFQQCEHEKLLLTRSPLFCLGDFTLHSGARSMWKIDCDALTDTDIDTLAYVISRLVGPFATVEGIPGGGLRLAAALDQYRVDRTAVADMELDERAANDALSRHLIIDDVLTTGNSFRAARDARLDVWRASVQPIRIIVGAVVFARGMPPHWVHPLFQYYGPQ